MEWPVVSLESGVIMNIDHRVVHRTGRCDDNPGGLDLVSCGDARTGSRVYTRRNGPGYTGVPIRRPGLLSPGSRTGPQL